MTTINVSPVVNGDDGRRSNTDGFDAADNPIVGFENAQERFAWWRFPSATIPNGATIDVAYLTLVATSKFGTGDVDSIIYAVDEDDHTAPTSDAEWLTDHGIHTTASTVWTFTPKSSDSFQTPSIVDVIQEIVDRGSWSSGNDIGIHVDEVGTTTAGDAQIFDDVEGTTEAVLHVGYTAANGVTAGVTRSEQRILPPTTLGTPLAAGFRPRRGLRERVAD